MMSRLQTVIDDFKSLGLDFRINDLNEAVEAYIPKYDEWRIIDDNTEAIIRTALRELGYGVKGENKANRTAVKEAWITIADDNRYNPIHQYFDGLRQLGYTPKMEDGKPTPHVIYSFCNTYFDNPDTMFGHWLFKWMTAAIAKVYTQERAPILVMGGAQERGKSYFVRWLAPLDEYFREGAIRPDVKDERIRLTDIFMQEVPELGNSTRRADVDAFKDHISRKWVIERPAYGRVPTRKPCMCNFFATVNPDGAGFLIDSTGNSRFLICEVNAIDFNYSQSCSDGLWKEALWFYDKTFKPWELNNWERQRRDEINAKYQMVNALDDVIDTHFELTFNPDDWLATVEIRNFIAPHYRINSENGFARELARVLKAKKLVSGREAYVKGMPHRNGWFGIRKLSLDLNDE